MKVFSNDEDHFEKLVKNLIAALARGGGGDSGCSVLSAVVNRVLQRKGIQHAREMYKRYVATFNWKIFLSISPSFRPIVLGEAVWFEEMDWGIEMQLQLHFLCLFCCKCLVNQLESSSFTCRFLLIVSYCRG